MSKEWYVVQTFSNYERKAIESLKERIHNAGKEQQFGGIHLPEEEVTEMRAGQKRTSKRKFYPGYIIVEAELDDEIQLLVQQTPRIAGFVGGEKPVPLKESEIREIKERMEKSGEKAAPKELYEPGEEIRVIDGPFNDFNGTVEEVNYDKSRLKVSVMIFGRLTPVDLAFEQVKKF